MVVQPLVEGHGEVEAVPVLLRRLQAEAGRYGFQVARPFRATHGQLTKEESVQQWVRLALGTEGCEGIIVVFDGDDDPACTIGPAVKGWAQAAAGPIPCEVVVATREYEAWLISSLESLRGLRGIVPMAVSHPSPETVRDAKSELQARMARGQFYSPKVDQAALTGQVDLAEVHRRCRSFRKMVKAFGDLTEALTGDPLANWPPVAWHPI
jgi:Domain of unknown function (DUF4276)